MIYGPNSKSNLVRLGKLGTKVPFFPNWRNKRSMLYIDNLGEFVKQAVNKMFADSYYVPEMSEYGFEYQIVSFEESLKRTV